MNTALLNFLWRAAGQVFSVRPGARVAALLAFPLSAAHLMGGATPVLVDTLTGGPSQNSPPYHAYVDGNTADLAQFYNPIGLAMDTTGNYLYVADRDNNAVRVLDLPGNYTSTFLPNVFTLPGEINRPVGVAMDAEDNLYVLNRGNGSNGSIKVFDYFGQLIETRATALVNANAIALDAANNAYVTSGNSLIQITTNGVKSTVATITASGASLHGVTVMESGLVAVCDSGRHGILLINPVTGVVSNHTGFNGVGDNTGVNNRGASRTTATFNRPTGLAKTGGGFLIVADSGNHRVKVVNPIGTVTNLYGVSSNLWVTGPHTWPGWWDGTVWAPDVLGTVEARDPKGVLFSQDGAIYVTEDYYHLIRKATGANLPPFPPPPPTILSVLANYGQVTLNWSASPGATGYHVKRAPSSAGPYTIIANVTTTSYTDSTGLLDGATYYYVVSALGAGGESANSAPPWAVTLPMPPVPDPIIGYVDFPPTGSATPPTSVFHPVSSHVLNNDTLIVIQGVEGSQTFYTYGPTPASGSIPDPTTDDPSAPSGYQDGLSPIEAAFYRVAEIMPDLTIKAIGTKADGSPNSAIAQARFQFITANPVITGNNAAQFTVSDLTTDALMWYTVDGTEPTNAAPSFGPIGSGTKLSLQFPAGSNTMTFRIRAFRDNYKPSGVVSAIFSITNFQANTISFGFASGEASSEFIASPGQFFYAPVTLNPLPDTRIYSLQFNVTVGSGGPNPGPAITPGAYNFQSFLEKPDLKNPGYFIRIPPAMFLDSLANPLPVIPTNAVFPYNDGWFEELLFSNTSSNLLGVGWLERAGKTNLYDTTSQDLITYSQPHDTLFRSADGKVVLGGYAFRVPLAAVAGDTYQIQIGRPSATSDGIGAPGHDVYIATPINGSLYGGAINSIKIVTAGQRKYVVGDSAPFRWFNAGDFGNTNTPPLSSVDVLNNSDVMQVFQSAIYHLNYPPPGSDFRDCMDSCGAYGIPASGYWVANTNITDPDVLNQLFDGNDTDINNIAFGDGVLDVCDVYVTFRRSLDPSLTWWQRFWTNGILGATPLSQPKGKGLNGPAVPKASLAFLTNPPSVNFTAGDATTSAGQTVYIPITASIFGDYPLRVLMLNLSVEPLEGSPALGIPVQFTPQAALGAPSISSSIGNGNYAATWLRSDIAGLSGTATLGTLAVTLPAGIYNRAAYAVHFDHASASPNGIASFPSQTRTGLILIGDWSGSIYNDGIPDSWRLRYFGTVNNLLAHADADADGDGAPNWHEYLASTDPLAAQSVLRVLTDRPLAGESQNCVIRWPGVAGKRYRLERSATLFNPVWTPVYTNTGSGREMQYQDPAGGAVRFYRVTVIP